MPLLDMVPATPTTMQTSIKQAKKLAVQHGQAFCMYTSDQQIYRIALTVLWNTPDISKDLSTLRWDAFPNELHWKHWFSHGRKWFERNS